MIADGTVRPLSLSMSLLALTCPLLVIAGATPAEGERAIMFPLVLLGIAALTLLSALRTYRKDLHFYAENSMAADSQVQLHVKIPGGASGRMRLLFYYPFTFLSASLAVAVSIVFLL